MISHNGTSVLDKHGYDVVLDISGSRVGGHHHSSGSNSSCISTSTVSTSLSLNSSSSSITTNSNNTGSSSARWHHRLVCCSYRTKARYSNSGGFRLLAWLLAACLFISFYWFGSGYMRAALVWIETQNPWVTFCVFQLGFAIVSFPVVVGYLILIITSGYLFGCIKGLATVVIGANVGAALAHHIIHNWHTRLPIQRLLKNDTGKAILRVISGPRAFKVVLLARLTPIPFGLQNTIFGVSNVHRNSYYLGTMLGLFPAQFINVYIGSSLRSMHDVLNNHSTALTSYGVFGVQICIGIVLMTWVVHKARRELAEALLQEIDSDYKGTSFDGDSLA